MVGRVIIIHRDRGHEVDGIRDHTRRLGEELARRRPGVAALKGRPGRAARPIRILRRLGGLGATDVVVVQYSPFCYGRWGFAPWLPAGLLALRARRRRPTVALMIHEPFVPMSSWRWVLMGLWQRLQLAALRLAADVVFTSIEPWARRFESPLTAAPVHHLPVGSNFPDGRARRSLERVALAVGPGTLVVSCLGRDHPGWLADYVVAAANAMAAMGVPVLLLNLGGEAPPLDGLGADVVAQRPGYLNPEALAAKLAASDLFLAPVLDGVSTRRGSLMAALQHGLPVLGTVGPLTDSVLREARAAENAIDLVPVGDSADFAAAAARLAADPAARAALGTAGRRLYEREFDWPITAERLLAALPER